MITRYNRIPSENLVTVPTFDNFSGHTQGISLRHISDHIDMTGLYAGSSIQTVIEQIIAGTLGGVGTAVWTGDSNLVFNVSLPSPSMYQAYNSAIGAVGQTMSIHAQDCNAGGGSFGGSLNIRAGYGTTHGQLNLQSSIGDNIISITGGAVNSVVIGTRYVKWNSTIAAPSLYIDDSAVFGYYGQALTIHGQDCSNIDSRGGDVTIRAGYGIQYVGNISLQDGYGNNLLSVTSTHLSGFGPGGSAVVIGTGTAFYGPETFLVSGIARIADNTSDSAGLIMESGYSLTTSGFNQGRIRYNEIAQKFEISCNTNEWGTVLDGYSDWVFDKRFGAPYIYQATDDSDFATGKTIVIHGQDCTGLYSAGGSLALRAGNGTASNGNLYLQDGYGNVLLYIASVPASGLGPGGSAVLIGTGTAFYGPEILLVSGIARIADNIGDNAGLILEDGLLLPISELNQGRIRYNEGIQRIQTSCNNNDWFTTLDGSIDWVFDMGLAGPKIYQETDNTDFLVGQTLTIHPQDCTGIYSIGGSLALRPGNGTEFTGNLYLQDGYGNVVLYVTSWPASIDGPGGSAVLIGTGTTFYGPEVLLVSGIARIADNTSDTAGLILEDGASLPVSAANQGRIRYNEGDQLVEISCNGDAWGHILRGSTDVTLDNVANRTISIAKGGGSWGLTVTGAAGADANGAVGQVGGTVIVTGATGGAASATKAAGKGGNGYLRGGDAGSNALAGGGNDGGEAYIYGGDATGAGNHGKVGIGAFHTSLIELGNVTDNTPITQLGVGAVSLKGNIGFFSTAAQAQQDVTGNKGGNTALASLLTALAAYGLITDSTGA